MRMRDVRKMDKKALTAKIQEVRVELGKLRMDSAKGTLRKDSGKIRPMKKSVARMLTRLNEVDSE